MFDTAYLQELFQQWGYLSYLIIVGWTFIEGETIVIIAGFLSSQGLLVPWLIALCAFAGSFCSDQLMFFLGRRYGPAIFKKFPRLDKNTEKARELMLKYENLLILGFRFVYGVRNITPIMLGMSGVNHAKFLVLNFIGAVVWAFSFAYGGYYLGEVFFSVISEVTHGAAVGIGLLVLLLVVMWWIRRKRDKADIDNAQRVAAEGLAKTGTEKGPGTFPQNGEPEAESGPAAAERNAHATEK